MEVKPVAMVLADISGYTRFLRYHTMAVLHAEQIIADLLEAVIDSARYPLAVSKVEGDAVFFYASAPDEQAALTRDVVAQIERFYEAFSQKRQVLIIDPVCLCDACRSVDQLTLKVILHHGEVAFKRIKQFTELGGEEVVLAHRLLKNSIPSREYVLMTERFYRLSGGIPGQQPELRAEDVADIGKVPVRVFYKDRAVPTAGSAEAAAEPARPTFIARLRQYLRVNRHAVMRRLGLKPKQQFLHLPQ